jgi:hypothetical protein
LTQWATMHRIPLCSLLCSLLTLGVACDGPHHLVIDPDARLPPPTVVASPPPGLFNGSVIVTLTADREATVHVGLDGDDPRTSATARLSGPSPFSLTLSKTTALRYFATAYGRDGELREGQWVRAGGPAGTVSGVVVVGGFVSGLDVGLAFDGTLRSLAKATGPTELPFLYEQVDGGTHRLVAIADRDGDGELNPMSDLSSTAVTVTLDLADPLRASAEGLRLFLGSSGTGLGTLRGTIGLPRPPPLQALRISALSTASFTGPGGTEPQALLAQLQNGDRLLTSADRTQYPYVLTDLTPGQYVPVPSLIGVGLEGTSINFVANPLRAVAVRADEEASADVAFGPVTLSGQVTMKPPAAPPGPGLAVLAAKAVSFAEGIQGVLLPVFLLPDPGSPGDVKGAYRCQALRANTLVTLRVFTGPNPTTLASDALQWIMNPFSTVPGHSSVQTSANDVTHDFVVQ